MMSEEKRKKLVSAALPKLESFILNRTTEKLKKRVLQEKEKKALFKQRAYSDSTIIKLFPAGILTWIRNHNNQAITLILNVGSSDSAKV